jgi:GT2 family glycosyltransferase
MTGSIFSILLTTYECQGMGPLYTEYNLKRIFAQTYRPLQVVVSDHSKDDEVEDMVKSLDTSGVDLVYTRYRENYGNPCANWTNALQYAKGDYINYFAMDDYLYDTNSVKNVVEEFEKNPSIQWMACRQRIIPGNKEYIPQWPGESILFQNLIGGPSGVIIRSNLKDIQLSPEFIWLLDVDLYYRLYLKVGQPYLSQIIYYINRINPAYQLTNQVCDGELRVRENISICKKYGILKDDEQS